MSVLSPLPEGALIGPDVAPQADRQARRDALFQETLAETLQRVVPGTAWSLQPERIDRLVPLAKLSIAHLFEPSDKLPDLTKTPDAGELVGIADDLSAANLEEAYERGLFPHAHFGPTKWLSPPERCVLFFEDFHISKRLRRFMRQNAYTVTFDRDFEGVIKACAGKREGRWHLTWITPRIMRAFAALHDAGIVHSFEVWNSDSELAGGGYGVAVGRVCVIESQFFRESNASNIGFAVLAWHLAKWGFVLMDNKWLTPATERAGFKDIFRQDYLAQLPEHWESPIHPGR